MTIIPAYERETTKGQPLPKVDTPFPAGILSPRLAAWACPRRGRIEPNRMQTKPAVSRAKAYLKVRHKSVRDAMKQLKLDGLLITHPPDLAWLTDFTGDDSVGLI